MVVVFFLGLLSWADAEVGDGCESDCALPELPEIVDVLEAELAREAEGADTEESEGLDSSPDALPQGEIDAEALLELFEQWSKDAPSFLEILAGLADGETRKISGDAVREAAKTAEVTLPNFVPIDALDEIVIEDLEIRVLLTDDLKIPVAKKKTLVLDVQDNEDPFAVDGASVLMQHESGSYKLHINEEIVFSFNSGGLTGVREGDLVGSWFIFSRDIALRTVHGETDYEKLDGMVVVQVDDQGNPVIVDGRYVPKEADEWLEVTSGSDVSRVGIPRLGQ